MPTPGVKTSTGSSILNMCRQCRNLRRECPIFVAQLNWNEFWVMNAARIDQGRFFSQFELEFESIKFHSCAK